MAIVLSVVSAGQAIAQGASSQTRQQAFTTAAKEFGVPEKILLGISYSQSRWENHGGNPSVGGGFGLMHLTAAVDPEDGRGDPARPLKPRQQVNNDYSLEKAAQLLNLPSETLKKDDRQNVRGGAAVLAQYAKDNNSGKLPSSLNDWYAAVARLSGAAEANRAQDFADSVYASIQKGASLVTTDGQSMTLASENVQPNRALLGVLGLPNAPQEMSDKQTECPQTLTCRFVPARFAQNDPADPTNYGNYDTANRPRDMKIKYIVIHDTEGSYESAISWFQDPRSYVAAHYVIRSSDGEVTQMVRNKDVGWHAGNWYMNMHSIGIEHEGFAAEGATWYTEAMYRSSAKLVRYLADRYDIPLDRQHIVGHDQYHGLTPARAKLMHWDPGPYWDWDHYMSLLHGEDDDNSSNSSLSSLSSMGGSHPYSSVVAITPNFARNQPPVTSCSAGVCTELPRQGANFVYLRTAPRANAPLLTDAGLHPDGSPGTTEISDWSAKAFSGQKFAVAGRDGDWTAIWFGGQKGWFYNPTWWPDRTATPSWSRLISPAEGKTTIPVYGRALPEPSAPWGDVPVLTLVPLQYTIAAGQSYPAYDRKAINDYYHVLAFDRSTPGDGTIVVGNERFIPIEYNHRQAFVKASDVRLRYY